MTAMAQQLNLVQRPSLFKGGLPRNVALAD
jgi:hypothetical protein